MPSSFSWGDGRNGAPSTLDNCPVDQRCHDESYDIAIVGFSFQLPQAGTINDFWDLMISGRCTASEFPPDRLCSSKYHGSHGSVKGSVCYILVLSVQVSFSIRKKAKASCGYNLLFRLSKIRPTKASFLQRDISAFDTRFFGMTSEESSGTDPQQRLLLETTYHAFEDGRSASSYATEMVFSFHMWYHIAY
jgi:hypothetical protein